MSGPKVVRVVTREEIMVICQAHLARLDKAMECWIEDGMRRGLLDADDIVAVQRRRDEIAAYLAADRFVDLQKAAPEEIEFLKHDLIAREEKAALLLAQARQRGRREVQAAASLLASLQKRGVDIPGEVREALEAAAKGRGDPKAAFAMGVALATNSATSNIQDLAQRLKGDEPRRQIEEWIGAHSKEAEAENEDPRIARIDARIEELALLLGREETARFEERLVAASGGGDTARHNLLIDSLNLDLAHCLAGARADAAVAAKLDQELAALRLLSPSEAGTFEARSNQAPPSLHAALLQEVGQAVERERSLHAAAARRAAILKGLAELGYEIGETMDAAWVKDGRLVLKKPAHLDYGMELIGGVNAERLQMRAVAFNPTLDPARDRDAEALWCGDVGQLEQHLHAMGAGLHIEKALAIGEAPLKRVVSADAGRSAVIDAPKLRTHDD